MVEFALLNVAKVKVYLKELRALTLWSKKLKVAFYQLILSGLLEELL